MIKPFTCRGFEGHINYVPERVYGGGYGGGYVARLVIADGVAVQGWGDTASAAKAQVRRKLDAVERAFRERGFRT